MARSKGKPNKYLVDGGNGDNPKLMAQSLSDGRDSLYLEFYLGYEVAESAGGKEYPITDAKGEAENGAIESFSVAVAEDSGREAAEPRHARCGQACEVREGAGAVGEHRGLQAQKA